MLIQPILFKNNVITKQNQQHKVYVSPVITSFKGINKSTLAPLEQIKDASGHIFIGENDRQYGYQLWHFASSEFFKAFVNVHEDLSELFKRMTFPGRYTPCDLDFVKSMVGKKNEAGVEFVKTVREKTGVDLLGGITHYRFIGQSELDVIKAGKSVEPRYHGSTFISVNPNRGYGLNSYKEYYRVNFKDTDNIIKNIRGYDPRQYSATIEVPYSYKDVGKVEKVVDGKWQEVEFLPKDKPLNIPPFKKLSDSEVKSIIGWHPNFEYKLSDKEMAEVQDKYGKLGGKYIETLCLPIDEDGIKFMTKLVNICDGKYAEYWRSNPDKLILINNAGSLHNKIDKNLSEEEWDIIINSFKTLFEGKVDAKTIEAVVEYKGVLFDNINGTIIHQKKIDKILEFLDKKESLNSDEIQQIRLTLNYLQDVLDDKLFVSDFNHEDVYKKFTTILDSLNKNKLNKEDINQFKNQLRDFMSSILDLWKEKGIQEKTNIITELIEKYGERVEGIRLNRVERTLKGSILSTIEIEDQPLSELMAKAKTDESLRNRISNYLNSSQPTIERDSFMSTSLPVVKAFNEGGDVHWALTPSKDVKGLYIEDAYDILRERKEGREAEILIQRGSKIQIKKAEFKNGIWELEGILTPSENLS